MPTLDRDQSSDGPSKTDGKPVKTEINLQELAERILDLMKQDARIEQERLGKKSRRNLGR